MGDATPTCTDACVLFVAVVKVADPESGPLRDAALAVSFAAIYDVIAKSAAACSLSAASSPPPPARQRPRTQELLSSMSASTHPPGCLLLRCARSARSMAFFQTLQHGHDPDIDNKT